MEGQGWTWRTRSRQADWHMWTRLGGAPPGQSSGGSRFSTYFHFSSRGGSELGKRGSQVQGTAFKSMLGDERALSPENGSFSLPISARRRLGFPAMASSPMGQPSHQQQGAPCILGPGRASLTTWLLGWVRLGHCVQCTELIETTALIASCSGTQARLSIPCSFSFLSVQ